MHYPPLFIKEGGAVAEQQRTGCIIRNPVKIADQLPVDVLLFRIFLSFQQVMKHVPIIVVQLIYLL